jgi:hypothetical protein
MRSGPATQHGAVAARRDGRRVPRLPRRRAMTDPVDAPVLDEEKARAEPSPDLFERNASGQQRAPGHHTVPLLRERTENLFHRPVLVLHSNT